MVPCPRGLAIDRRGSVDSAAHYWPKLSGRPGQVNGRERKPAPLAGNPFRSLFAAARYNECIALWPSTDGFAVRAGSLEKQQTTRVPGDKGVPHARNGKARPPTAGVDQERIC